MGPPSTSLTGFSCWTLYGLYSVIPHCDRDWGQKILRCMFPYVVCTDLHTEYDDIILQSSQNPQLAGLFAANTAELSQGPENLLIIKGSCYMRVLL